MVSHPKEYPWSSYRFYAEGVPSKVVDVHPLYEELAQTEATRRRRYQEFIEIELQASQKGSAMRFSEQQVYGGEHFLKDMAQRFDLTPFPRPPGRPSKNRT